MYSTTTILLYISVDMRTSWLCLSSGSRCLSNSLISDMFKKYSSFSVYYDREDDSLSDLGISLLLLLFSLSSAILKDLPPTPASSSFTSLELLWRVSVDSILWWFPFITLLFLLVPPGVRSQATMLSCLLFSKFFFRLLLLFCANLEGTNFFSGPLLALYHCC